MAGMTSRVIKSMPRTATSWDIRPSRPQKTMYPGSTTSMMRCSFLVTVSGFPGDDLVRGVDLLIAEAGAARGDIGRAHPRLFPPALRGLPAHVPRGLQP